MEDFESEMLELIHKRDEVLKEATDKQKQFFETAHQKLKILSETLEKYKMLYLLIPFNVSDDYGIFSTYGKATLMITSMGIGIIDTTKESTDKTRFVGLSLESYRKRLCEKDQGDMINLTTYIIKELDTFKEAELTGIRAFYQKQLDDARENSEGWSDLVQSIA